MLMGRACCRVRVVAAGLCMSDHHALHWNCESGWSVEKTGCNAVRAATVTRRDAARAVVLGCSMSAVQWAASGLCEMSEISESNGYVFDTRGVQGSKV